MSVSTDQVMGLLSTLVDPHTGLDMVTGKQVKKVDLNGKKLDLQILLGYPAAGYHATLKEQIMAHLGAGLNLEAIRIDIQTAILSHAVQKNLKPLAGVKNIIAVASGKGGVGKSTTAVNLALALHADGARTGLLDADIYGPSQPLMLGVKGKPDTDGKSIYPLQAHGLQSMSIGYLVDEETPMIWRGPMVTGALQQLLRDTRWDQLDYLIMDLPPGTGDIQLTLAQQVPVSGAVIVTTPQDIALLDARRGLHMFEKVSVPVLGIVENMSLHVCSRCGHTEPLFGEGGGQRMAEQCGVPLLGALPLDINIRLNADNGHPSVVAEPDGDIARHYFSIARAMSARLAQKARDFSHRFPTISVVND
ncbi:iron-sulfur cluster carrier protein ApbC [Candidatus Woesearchaeota archaeon]|jgi:ATP-binding protein involved in chromosome partitioning|nr:iron-sulfur cluster carrier protein ApbC [Candidatus Woesearchaeota archaeon]